jgi:FMN phosphatase YigB (HAD superfamily)
MDFVKRVTTPSGTDFVPERERIATFDNDGTLWAEQPIYFQFAFVFDRIKAMGPQHPEWKTKQPYQAVLDGDMEALAKGWTVVSMKDDWKTIFPPAAGR